jgi:hypothetical protein
MKYRTTTGLELVIQKHWYDGFWYVYYTDGMRTYSGPHKLKRNAVDVLETDANVIGADDV